MIRLILIIFFSLGMVLLNSQTSSAHTAKIKQTGFRPYTSEQGLSQNTINHIYQDNQRFIWLSTASGLNRLDSQKIDPITDFEQYLDNAEILSIKQDSVGNYWVATYEGLTKLDRSLTHSEHFDIPSAFENQEWANFPIDIFEHKPNQQDIRSFWLVTVEGVFKLNEAGRDIQLIPSMQEMAKEEIYIYTATQIKSVIWLSTSKGLYVFDTEKETLNKFDVPIKNDEPNVYEVLALSADKILVRYSDALVVTDDKGNINHSKEIYRTNKHIQSMVIHKNKLYFSIDDSLFLLDLQTFETNHLFNLSNVLPNYVTYFINRLFIDGNDKLWIGTTSRGAFVWDPESLRFESLLAGTQNSGAPLKTIWSFHADSQENYWIGSEVGLHHLNTKTKVITQILSEDTPQLSPSRARIFQIVSLNQDELWLGTGDGLIQYSISQKTATVHRPNFIPENSELFIYSMTSLGSQSLWIATDRGPLHFDFESKTFRYETPLMSEDKREISAFVKHYDDKLWFGFSKKLLVYDYEKQRAKKIFEAPYTSGNSEIYLTDFRIKGDYLWTAYSGKGIYVSKLNSDTQKIVHHFSTKTDFIDDVIYSLLPDGDYFWASSHSGLIKINSNDFSYEVFDYFDGIPGNEFNEGAYLKTEKALLFGGSNDILIVTPEKFDGQREIPIPSVSAIRISDRYMQANAIDWSDRNIRIKADENFIQFTIASLDFLTPDRWQYQYWLTGDFESEKVTTKKPEVIFSDLKSGSYTLNIESYSNTRNQASPPIKIAFTVDSPFWLTPTVTQTAYVLLVVILFWMLYRRGQIKNRFVSLYHQLKDKEQRLQLALLDDRRGIWEWRLNGKELLNSNLNIIFTEEENISLSLHQYMHLIHEDDRERVKSIWFQLLNGELDVFEEVYRVFLFERWVWTKVYGRIFSKDENGVPEQAVGSWLDISRDKSYEESLSLYKSAVQNTQDIVIITNQRLQVFFVNSAYQKLSGFNNDNILNKNILRIGKRYFSLEFVSNLKQSVRNNQSWRGELLVPKSDGTSFSASVTIDEFKSESNKSRYVIVISDLSGIGGSRSMIAGNSDDSLSSIPNKTLINDRLVHALEHARANHSKVTILQLQLFALMEDQITQSEFTNKQLNTSGETLGRLLEEDDTVARLGKDRFLVMMEDDCDIETIIFRIDRLLTRLNAQLLSISGNEKLQFKTGVSLYPTQESDAQTLLAESAEALRLIRNTSEFYRFAAQSTQQLAIEKVGMKQALSSALKNDQIFLVFQPKKDIHTFRTVGFEVLMRWKTPDGNIIYPSQFLELANQASLIGPLTDWLIKKSTQILGRWKNEGIRTAFSLNLVPGGEESTRLVNRLFHQLELNDLSAKDIHIEINEKDASVNSLETYKLIESLAEHNFRVTLDDFGKWELPFSRLKGLPIYAIKMHRDFTRAIGKDKNNEAIIRMTHQLCEQFNFMMTAKGIESREQIEYLRELGCNLVQGYYFADPMSESQARQFILENK